MLYKTPFLLLLLLLARLSVSGQASLYQVELLFKMDSLSKKEAPSRHFASLYLETMQLSMLHFAQSDSGHLDFIHRFEVAFAEHFFRATGSQGRDPEAAAWLTYFNDRSKNALQYQLLGINAHINADLSSALIHTFSLTELKANKKAFLRFQQGLKSQFFRFYELNKKATWFTRFLDNIPFNLARGYGSSMMSRWRKRQYKIALLHFKNPEKSIRLRSKTQAHKDWIDQQILRLF